MQDEKIYDVAIIGAGISGLMSAALLSKTGLSCIVIEMDGRPGGYMAGFNRKGFRFDSAIHWLNDCGPNGLITKIFKIIGDNYPKASEQKHIRRFISDDTNYLVTNKPDLLKQQWIDEFPEDKAGIIRFFRDAKRIAKSFDKHINLSRSMDTMNLYEKAIHGLKMLDFAIPFIPHIRYSSDLGVQKALSKYFKSEKLKQIFSSEPDFLSCLIPISWAYSNNFQKPPTGGSQAYPEWLYHASEAMGADIRLQSKVTEITLKNGQATGLKYKNKDQIYQVKSKYIVAACDAETLFEKILPKGSVPNQKINNLKDAKLYASALTISIGLNCPAEELGLGEENIYLSDPNLSREILGSGEAETTGIHILAPSVSDKSLAPKGKGTLTLFIPAFIESYNYWACKKDEQGNFIRGNEYQQLKQKIANIIINRVEDKVIPNLQKHIELIDIATPITHLRYTGNKNGTMMGQRPGKENMQKKVASYKTDIPNVLLSGHWADLGGGVPIAIKSAVNTSLIILKKENRTIFKQLAAYIDGKIDINKLKKSANLQSYKETWEQDLTPAQKQKFKD